MVSSPAPSRFAALLALAFAFAAPATFAQEGDELSQGLIRLRGEVEQLNTELELLREEQRTALAGLAAQKAELQASVDRQQLAARELREKLDAARAEVDEAGVAGDELVPRLLAAADQLERHIRAGLPFMQEQRLADLAEFRTQLGNGTLPPQRAVNRLWAFYEDEFRLTRENGLHNQTVTLEGENVLAEVAKVGTMLLYFRTQDGRVGQAVRQGDGWAFVPVTDDVDVARIDALFDSLRKQIRQGFFELPLAQTGAAS